MPTYSYACTECDNRFDVVQSFTDDSLTTCDQCSGRLRKLFSPVGVVFKGSGFYHNDSREARKAATNGSGHGERNGHGKSGTGSDDSSGSDKSGTSDTSTTSSGATSGNGNKSDKSDKSSSSSDSTATAVASKASS